MSNKKHIDRVFQEKLKDFEATPSPKVWKSIKGELESTNKDKKVYPIWLRIAGIAALLLILLTVGNAIVSNTSDSKDHKVVDTEKPENNSEAISNPQNSNANILTEDPLNSTENKALTESNLSEIDHETLNPKNNKTTSTSEFNNTSVVASNKNSASQDYNTTHLTSNKTLQDKIQSPTVVTQSNKVASTSSQKPNHVNTNNPIVVKNSKDVIRKNLNTINDASESRIAGQKNLEDSSANAIKSTPSERLAQNNSDKQLNTSSSLPEYDENSKITTTNNSNKKRDLYGVNVPSESTIENQVNPKNSDGKISSTTIEGIAQNNTEKQDNSLPEFDKEKADAVLKNTSKDVIAEANNTEDKEEEITASDETQEESPSIEEEIAKVEDIIEKEEEKVDRWQVYANVAPVYYNTLGKGSHIDDEFVENSKSGEINMSYGVNVSYALSKKLKLRAGFNSLDLSYDTDNVILYESVGNNNNGAQPRNLNLNTTGQSFSAISASNIGAQQLGSVIGGNVNAAISQRLAYYEVPLELEYNLVNRKLGVNVIGGFSTFILNDNKVYSEFDGYKTHVGEANNINDVSFSGNLGLGLDYKFSNKIKLNVQPTFKYQFNAYENTSGNFRPYIVGIYTGLSYKF
ncbi:hypothetical protein ACFS5M_02185 [Lacinutrix iliipiscaria]|uniref:Outer membrane protein beta-barrel domain-containing protein n=1 Tax=Lacinutrix iliipiscaria TaxID=1230532 RepID=A0ABW5WIZ3_9FLAO